MTANLEKARNTYSEGAKIIGKKGSVWAFGDIHVDVKVKDYKQAYGKSRWLVEPLKGSGEAWVETVRVDEKTYTS